MNALRPALADIYTPIIELALPEVDPEATLADRLHSLLVHDIPGFVIRHAGEEDITLKAAKRVASTNVSQVRSIVSELHPGKTVRQAKAMVFRGRDNGNHTGPFHNDIVAGELDVDPMLSATELLVHTTLVGRGTVYIAAMGTNPRKTYDAEFHNELPLKRNIHPHELLLQGFVNPELTDPRIYSATLRSGDTVVMAEKGRHSAWHRFDTDAGSVERLVSASLIKDKTSKAKQARIAGFQPGFDLL